MIAKLNLYNQYGIKEYWIANPLNETILVYVLEDENFGAPTSYTFQDIVQSVVLEVLVRFFKPLFNLKRTDKIKSLKKPSIIFSDGSKT